LIEQVRTEMAAAGDVVTVVQACCWAGISRRSYCYQPTKAKPRINELLAARVKRVISDLPYAGYRTVAWLLGENKNTIQRLFQIKGWQVRKRRSGARPRVQALHSVASRPNERWATDIARVWCGPVHRWCALTIVMDCHTREALGWRLSPSGNAKAAEAALEEALISRYGTLGRAREVTTAWCLPPDTTLGRCTNMVWNRSSSDPIPRSRTGWLSD